MQSLTGSGDIDDVCAGGTDDFVRKEWEAVRGALRPYQMRAEEGFCGGSEPAVFK